MSQGIVLWSTTQSGIHEEPFPLPGGRILTWYVVDGLDGSGKSTVAEEMASRLRARGRKVLVRTHPGDGSRWGRISSRYLLKHGKPAVLVTSVFYFLDVLHSIWALRHSDREYDDVIFVRYLLEVAYFPDSVYRVCHRVASGVLPEPDVSILVDIDPGTAMERILQRGGELEAYEEISKLERTRRHMLDIAGGWYVLDNNGSVEETMQGLDELLGNLP